MTARLDVLRALDAFDRLGPLGVFERLTDGRRDPSGAWTQGCGIARGQAVALAGLVDTYGRVGARIRLMFMMEEHALGPGASLWDELLGMSPNEDETWAGGGRPSNIGFALDDIIHVAESCAVALRNEGARFPGKGGRPQPATGTHA